MKITLFLLLSLLGLQQAKAEAVSPYTVDFNSTINTGIHDFAVASNWGHIVPVSDYDGYGPYYMSYSYAAAEGIDESGAVLAYRQYAGDNWGGEEVKDVLVTPKVSGEVALYVKAGISASSSNPAFVEFYTVNSAGTAIGSLIQRFAVAELQESDVEGWKRVSINVSSEQRVAIRAQHVYMDNFSATTADIVKERKLTITSLASPTGSTPVVCNQRTDGSVDVTAKVTVQNNGDEDLRVGDEDFTLTFVMKPYYSAAVVYEGATFAIPVDVAVGKSATFEATFNVTSFNTSATNSGYFYIKVRENVSGSTSSAELQAKVQEYQSKFIFDKEGTTYYSSSSSTSTPIDLGKVSAETSVSYEIYNDGTAPLVIHSISVPAPFTSDAPTGEFTLAGGEKKVITITLPIDNPGIFVGTLAIDYTNFGKERATYNLAISGTVIDPSRNLITFSNSDDTNGQFPAGSIHSDQVYITQKTEGDITNYFLQSTSTTTKFITPLLTAQAGESFTYDAWYSSYSSSAAVTVYTSADRVNWTQVDKLSTSNLSTTMRTFTVTLDEAGDYYLAFELQGNALLDNIYGLTPAEEPEHDWYIAQDATIPAKGTQNIDYTASIQVHNISAADDVIETATLYMGGEAVATVEGTALAGNAKTAAIGTGRNNYSNIEAPATITFTFKPHEYGTFATYIELKAGDTVLTTDEVEVTIAQEAIVSELAIGDNSGVSSNSPLNLNFNNSETVSLYNAAKLAKYGLQAGDKIQSITYKAYKTGADHTTVFSAYYEWTDEQTQAQPTSELAYDTKGMTAIVENERHTWPKTEGGSGVYEDYLTFTFAEPLVYQEGMSLRLVVRSENDTEKNNYSSVNFERGETYGNHYYHRNDSRSDVKVTVDGREVNSKIGINASWYADYNPVIYFALAVEPVNVSGVVTDSDGQPIEGATVTVYNEENDVEYVGTTDSEGRYAVDVIQDRLTYIATATAEGYEEEASDEFNFAEGSVTQDFTLVEAMPETVTITLTADGTSYSGKWTLDFSGLDIIPFKATQKTPKTVHVESVTIVPDHTGVIIKGEPGVYEVPTTTEATDDDFSDNLLVENVDEAYTVTAADEGMVYRYVNNNGEAMFQKAKAGQTVSAGKAYLRLAVASALDFLGFDDDTTTGISQVAGTADTDAPAYNLGGQRVSGSYKGVVIQLGKKMVRK